MDVCVRGRIEIGEGDQAEAGLCLSGARRDKGQRREHRRAQVAASLPMAESFPVLIESVGRANSSVAHFSPPQCLRRYCILDVNCSLLGG